MTDIKETLDGHKLWSETQGERGSQADLRLADLRLADLRLADLRLADLREADLRGAFGNFKEVRSLQVDRWHITYTADILAVGCQQHSIEDWWSFSDMHINAMDPGALVWWRKWKPILKSIIAAAPATLTSE